ncbi:CPBP family intramembrane metalloprotease [candidate division WOR-3 bacterium]|uniref:CPBP family intramembrane metalloprotease n=1 Tax=candidate division WOR-3 bacterium TaxID=2052148 RepID=A0A9D5KBW0_UNCW3|nr:CPBP family intramembrane metalloprotease [candidate division WOR-3 bacterium]MBD3364896.1 CPBP family intramembrane metalloprotease [candidate division WOR-3 bacterium]
MLMDNPKDTRFLGYYWDELKRLLQPATPILVTAIYSFVLIFERKHYKMFRISTYEGLIASLNLDFGSIAERDWWFPVMMGLRGIWYMLIPLVVIGILFVFTSLPREKSNPLPGFQSKGLLNWFDNLWLWTPLSVSRSVLGLSKGTRRVFPQHRFSDYGFRLGRWVGWRDSLIFFAIMIPFVAFAVLQGDFSRTYPLANIAERTLGWFIIWETFHLLHMFGWEFLNRGFLLFGLEKIMGRWAILATAIPFALLHMGKPELETYGSFIAAIALGWVALRTRSFLPGVFLHWSVALIMDILAVLMSGGFTG